MKRKERKAAREAAKMAAISAVADVIIDSLKAWRPTLTHKIEYGPKPKPVYVNVIIENSRGERWMVPGMTLFEGQRYYHLPGSIPLSWLTGHDLEGQLPLGQMMLEFQWDERK